MSDPDALRSIFEDPMDLEMDDLAKPNPILRLKWLIQSIQSTRRKQCLSGFFPRNTPSQPTALHPSQAELILHHWPNRPTYWQLLLTRLQLGYVHSGNCIAHLMQLALLSLISEDNHCKVSTCI